MAQFTMADLQDYLYDVYLKPEHTTGLFMKLVEEIGEVAEALNQKDGRKAVEDDTSLAYELADVIHYTVAIAAINNIDLSETILEKDKQAAMKYNHKTNFEKYLKE